jgi:hypothetical protein
MKHTATHCHCGADRQGSDHCPECGCEEFESVCDHVAERKLFNRGNLFTGDPYGVEVIGYFGSSELHGPFSSENEAWNYGMALALSRDTDYEKVLLVRIETPVLKRIVTSQEVRDHREATAQ